MAIAGRDSGAVGNEAGFIRRAYPESERLGPEPTAQFSTESTIKVSWVRQARVLSSLSSHKQEIWGE